MGLADAYKKLGSANVAIAKNEMKRETGMGMADALKEGFGFLSKAASDASVDAANLEAGETLLEGTGYSIDDTRVDASGKNHWYNPFTWGGYQVENTEGDIMYGRGAKESVRNLGVLSRSAAAAGTENEAILKKWADWNQFGATTATPQSNPTQAGDDLGDDRESPSRRTDTSRPDDYKTKIDWSKFAPKFDWTKLKLFQDRLFPNWRDTDTGLRTTGSSPRNK